MVVTSPTRTISNLWLPNLSPKNSKAPRDCIDGSVSQLWNLLLSFSSTPPLVTKVVHLSQQQQQKLSKVRQPEIFLKFWKQNGSGRNISFQGEKNPKKHMPKEPTWHKAMQSPQKRQHPKAPPSRQWSRRWIYNVRSPRKQQKVLVVATQSIYHVMMNERPLCQEKVLVPFTCACGLNL